MEGVQKMIWLMKIINSIVNGSYRRDSDLLHIDPGWLEKASDRL